MPSLACHICGRVVYTTANLESLFAEEQRCPRCGDVLAEERRVAQRRKSDRRRNPTDTPGPPNGIERRVAERRRWRRRRDDSKAFGTR